VYAPLNRNEQTYPYTLRMPPTASRKFTAPVFWFPLWLVNCTTLDHRT